MPYALCPMRTCRIRTLDQFIIGPRKFNRAVYLWPLKGKPPTVMILCIRLLKEVLQQLSLKKSLLSPSLMKSGRIPKKPADRHPGTQYPHRPGRSGGPLFRPSVPGHDPDRHYRDQRQNHRRLFNRKHPATGRFQGRCDRNDKLSLWGQNICQSHDNTGIP